MILLLMFVTLLLSCHYSLRHYAITIISPLARHFESPPPLRRRDIRHFFFFFHLRHADVLLITPRRMPAASHPYCRHYYCRLRHFARCR